MGHLLAPNEYSLAVYVQNIRWGHYASPARTSDDLGTVGPRRLNYQRRSSLRRPLYVRRSLCGLEPVGQLPGDIPDLLSGEWASPAGYPRYLFRPRHQDPVYLERCGEDPPVDVDQR